MRFLGLVGVVGVVVVGFTSVSRAATFTVDDLGELGDINQGDGICATSNAKCTLRAAMQEAEAAASSDKITFSVAGTIAPTTFLPLLFNPVVIDATTAPGYAGAPLIKIDCGGTNLAPFQLHADATIKGFSIERCLTGILVVSGAAVIQANYIGNDGVNVPAPHPSGTRMGIRVISTAPMGARIGGPLAADRNVISGNGTAIEIKDGSALNEIEGNYIGTNAAGTAAIPNTFGIVLLAAGNFTTIKGNVISGSSGQAVYTSDTKYVFLTDNKIGTNAAGTAAITNEVGAYLTGGDHHFISGNVISGTTGDGLTLDGCTSLTFLANRIGTNAAGTAAIANATGLNVKGGGTFSVGDGTPANRNVISGNAYGVMLSNSSGVNLIGNYIGPGAGGEAIGNTNVNVLVSGGGATDCTVGPGNILTGGQVGVYLLGAGGANLVKSNRIGTSIAGGVGAGNSFAGVYILSTNGVNVFENTIGGSPRGVYVSQSNDTSIGANLIGTDGTIAIPNEQGVFVTAGSARTIISNTNVISGNTSVGVLLETTGNTLHGNYIGTNGMGATAIPNALGVSVAAGGNTIQSNLISGNTGGGLTVASNGNIIISNSIGTTLGGSGALANSFGVSIDGDDNRVGGVASGNTIANNQTYGVLVHGAKNLVMRNSIYDNGTLGIDLSTLAVPNGHTSNDDPDSDGLQNAPVLASAVVSGTETVVSGTLLSTVSANHFVDVFVSASCDASGFGEARTYLGSIDVQTNASGVVSFTFTYAAALSIGFAITATASRYSFSTSELSACVATTESTAPPADLLAPIADLLAPLDPPDLAVADLLAPTETPDLLETSDLAETPDLLAPIDTPDSAIAADLSRQVPFDDLGFGAAPDLTVVMIGKDKSGCAISGTSNDASLWGGLIFVIAALRRRRRAA